jgi:hypothetical protein
MTTLGLIIVVAVLIGLFSYYTNAGFGDRRPKEPKAPADPPKTRQDSVDDAPPPSK